MLLCDLRKLKNNLQHNENVLCNIICLVKKLLKQSYLHHNKDPRLLSDIHIPDWKLLYEPQTCREGNVDTNKYAYYIYQGSINLHCQIVYLNLLVFGLQWNDLAVFAQSGKQSGSLETGKPCEMKWKEVFTLFDLFTTWNNN